MQPCYTVAIDDRLYVLHAFQKKAKSGTSTPKADIDLLRRRLREAKEHYERDKTATSKSEARKR